MSQLPRWAMWKTCPVEGRFCGINGWIIFSWANTWWTLSWRNFSNFRGFLIRTSYGWWSRDSVSVAATLFTFFKFQFAKTSKTLMLEVKIAPSKTSFLIFHWKDVARQRGRIATFKLEVTRNSWSGRSWNMQIWPPESSLYDTWHRSQKVDFWKTAQICGEFMFQCTSHEKSVG